VRIARPVAHVLILSSIGGGIWIGAQVYRILVGG
jgi:hypothetical protein